jgi:beta-glucosidase
VLLAHGFATQALRSAAPQIRTGITIDLVCVDPLTDSDEDHEAARRLDGSRNRWFLDPVLRGEYPADVLGDFAPLVPPIEEGDLEAIEAPIDFLGINYYTRNVVHARPDGGSPLVVEKAAERTGMGWEVYPQGLFELLVRLRDEYRAPEILVTENGAAYADLRHSDVVDDPERASYIERHVVAIARAIEHGVAVRGYFVWSLLDNFEWACGYSQRFGIVYVDFQTLERVPKTSYLRYRELIANQGRSHGADPEWREQSQRQGIG